jgi:hypothetical protein
MKKYELQNGTHIKALQYKSKNMPHASLETNFNCNLKCAFCYNEGNPTIKPFSQLQHELDLLQQHRPHLHALTLVGGEPLLHPAILSIVKEVRARGLLCQIMTNGMLLLESHGSMLLTNLQKAGVNRLALHIDEGQGDLETISTRRTQLFSLLQSQQMHFSLTITHSDNSHTLIPSLLLECSKYTFCDGILAFLAADHDNPLYPENKIEKEYTLLQQKPFTLPTTYIASNANPQDIRILIYYLLINSHTGSSISLSPMFNTVFTKLFNIFHRKNPFMIQTPPKLAAFSSFVVFLLESILQPFSFIKKFTILGGVRGLWHCRFFYVVIGAPPEIRNTKDPIHFCFHCPDATIRNDILMPPCIADKMSAGLTHKSTQPIFTAIVKHLEDAL